MSKDAEPAEARAAVRVTAAVTADPVQRSGRFGSYTLLYGIRYLNYIAHFNATGTLADRNTLVLPFLGFERTFGR